jgi:hypothetical protein
MCSPYAETSETSAGYAMRQFTALPSDYLVSSVRRAILLFHRCKYNTGADTKKENFRLNSLKRRINPEFHTFVSPYPG